MPPPLPTPVAVAAAIVLAAVLAWAAVAKARDRAATTEDFTALGLPWPAPLAVAVPVIELACAALLVVIPGWGGVAAFGLLVIFTANLAVVVATGRVVSCACFGAAFRSPVSVRHLARNGLLLLLALGASTVDQPVWRLDLFGGSGLG